MTALPEVANFDAEVTQIETNEPVIGGPTGVSNRALKQLANRSAESGLIERFAVNNVMLEILQPLLQARKELESLQDPGHIYLRCVSCAMVH